MVQSLTEVLRFIPSSIFPEDLFAKRINRHPNLRSITESPSPHFVRNTMREPTLPLLHRAERVLATLKHWDHLRGDTLDGAPDIR